MTPAMIPVHPAQWLRLMRPGDWVVTAAGLTASLLSLVWLSQAGQPDRVVIRQGGEIFRELPLNRAAQVEVPGPLGTSLIEIEPGRARVAADPGPRQYCVRQGWLERAGAVAICAPNQVSLSLAGGRSDYDSLNY